MGRGMQHWLGFAIVLAVMLFTKTAAIAFSATSTAKHVADALSTTSLKGRTAVITGANTGIGLEAAKALASKGCRVVLCSRDEKAAREAIEKEVKQAGLGNYVVESPDIVVKQLDLANLESVASLAADISKTEQVDYLVLNAGIMSLPTLERTKYGWEKQMAVNHFGHAALVKGLMPMLSKSRIVVLASTAHRFSSDKVVSDVTYKKRSYLPWTAYGDSKMANLLYAKGLAHHLKLDACSVHPGVIKTRLWNQSLINRAFSIFVGDRGVPEGAASTVWACLSPRTDLKGAYIADCAPALPNELAQSDALRDEVWRVTNEELARVNF